MKSVCILGILLDENIFIFSPEERIVTGEEGVDCAIEEL